MIEPNFWGVLSLFAFHAISLYFLYPSRYSKVKTVTILFVVSIFSFTSSWIAVQWSTSLLCLGLALSAVVITGVATVLFLSAYDVPKTLFLFFVYAQAIMVAIMMAEFLSQGFFGGSSASALFARTVLHIVIVFLCAVMREKLDILVQGAIHGWWPLDLVEALCFIYTSFFVLRVYKEPYGTTDIVSFLLFLMVIIAVYVVFFYTIRYMHSAAEQQKAELQSKFLLEQMRTMQESMEETRRLRHDARHHNLQILQYVKNGEQDALLEYLGEYEKETGSHAEVRICENLAANSILCAYGRKAEQSGIKVLFDVAMGQEIGIGDIDIVTILANLMENAINGCLRSGEENPEINVHISKRAGKLVIYINNSTDEGVVLENGRPQSKNGIGVSSILRSAARYGGEYDFQCRNGVFSCQIMLKVLVK